MGKFAVRLIGWLAKLPGFRAVFSLIEFIIRTLSDQVRQSRVAYLYGETADNQDSVLETALALLRSSFVEYIAIPGFEAAAGFPGYSLWKARLMEKGVPEYAIIAVPWENRNGAFNTLTESIDLITFAKTQDWKSLTIVAAPFHLPRCFLSVIGQVLARDSSLNVYARAGVTLPWTEMVTHSQGVAKGTRAGLIGREMMGILAYTLKGDLPRWGKALAYLNHRDS